MNNSNKNISPYKTRLSKWFVFRILVWFLGFVFLMSLPVWVSEGHRLYSILVGENNHILFTIVCAYLPFCGLIEYFFPNSGFELDQTKEQKK